jgi:hypothetical protein
MSTHSHTLIALGAAVLVLAAGLARAATPPTPSAGEASAATQASQENEGRSGARGGVSRGAPTARGGRGVPGGAPANLQSAMSDMNRTLRTLKAEATDPAKIEQTLADLATFERDVAISKTQVPPTVNRQPADEKAKSMASYRSMMNGLTRTLLDLEDAVNDKKPDEIKKLLAQLDEIEKQGHAEFKPAGD